MAGINEGLTYIVMAIWTFAGIYYIGTGELTIGGLMGFTQLSSSFNWPFYFLPSIFF